MSHHIYTTDAFILESAAGKEADKLFTLFTRELGMIRASAQGVRLLKSKLRYSLQDFSLSTVSTVRGKEWWRITNAEFRTNLYTIYIKEKYILYTFARIFRLLRRLVPEEEKNEALFNEVEQAVGYISENKPSREFILPFEYILALRILNHLGYVGNLPKFKPFLSTAWSDELFIQAKPLSKQFVTIINASIRESHL